MSKNRSGMSGRKACAHALIAACGTLLAANAFAYEPGWYVGFEGAYVKVEDGDGTIVVVTPGTPAAPGTPGATCQIPLPIGPVNFGGNCVIGAPTPGTPGTPGSPTVTSPPNPLSFTYDDGFGIGFNVGYLFEGGLRPELNFNYSENDLESITVSGSRDTNPDATTSAMRLMANMWYDLDFGGNVMPYLGGGVGMQRTTFDQANEEADDNTTAYQLGAGVNFWINPKTALSLDYRYVSAQEPEFTSDTAGGGSQTIESEYDAQTIGLSLRYAFGTGGGLDSDGDGVPDRNDKCPNTPKGVQVYSNGCPVDLDGDGVPDYLDKCPGTPVGTPVDARGCPADSDGDGVPDHMDKCPGTPRGVMVGPDGCPIDSDGDGIPDAYDKCPNTPRGVIVGPDGCPAADQDGDGVPDFMDKCPNSPKGVPVGPDGCPLDSDGDGIPDYLDECPNSPPGAKVLPNGCALVGDCRRPRPGEAVDAKGCALDKNFILRGVKFEFDSDRLTEPAKLILNEVAETLKAYPTITVDLEGHTDNIGTDAYNLGLSERRANSVKVYLSGHGVNVSRMNPVGYGESRPIDNNDTDDGRENNRRVELKVNE